MYEATETFKNALKEYIIRPALRGTINGENFTEEHIIEGTFRCCNQCTDVSEVRVGGVYIGELRMTLTNEFTRGRFSWVNKKIKCEYGLWTGERFEYIPTPSYEYTIFEATWTEAGLEIVAYDNMHLFDKKFTPLAASGVPYEWLSLACKTCGVGLGLDDMIFMTMPNGNSRLTLPADAVVDTWRDIVSYVAQALCGFATIDREGKLIVKQFRGTPVATVKARERFTGSSFSDYVTTFSGISVVSIIDGEEHTYTKPPYTGITMRLGANPMLSFGGNVTANDMRTNILDGLGNFAYRPFSVTTLGCCIYDLGDVIKFSEGIAIASDSCIMSYDFGLDSYSFAGYGANPLLENAKTKYDKAGGIGGGGGSKSNLMQVTKITNLEPVHISNEWEPIMDISFSVSSEQLIQFHGVAKVHKNDVDTVSFKYFVNGIAQDFIHEEKLAETDTATLFLVFPAEGNMYTNFSISAKTNGSTGTIDSLEFIGALVGVGLTKDESGGNPSASDNFSLKHRRHNKFLISETFVEAKPEGPIEILCRDSFTLKSNRQRRINIIEAKEPDVRPSEPLFRRITEDGKLRLTENTKIRYIENKGIEQ